VEGLVAVATDRLSAGGNVLGKSLCYCSLIEVFAEYSMKHSVFCNYTEHFTEYSTKHSVFCNYTEHFTEYSTQTSIHQHFHRALY